MTPTTEVKSDAPLKIKESAVAVADTAGYGQLWVKNETPNELYFTNDAGTDIQITDGSSLAGSGGGGVSTNSSSAELNLLDADNTTPSEGPWTALARWAKYSYSSTDGVSGTITLSSTPLPDNAIILRVYADTTVDFTSSGTPSIRLFIDDSNSSEDDPTIESGVTHSSYSFGIRQIYPASNIKLNGTGTLKLEITSASLTYGAVDYYIEYLIGA